MLQKKKFWLYYFILSSLTIISDFILKNWKPSSPHNKSLLNEEFEYDFK